MLFSLITEYLCKFELEVILAITKRKKKLVGEVRLYILIECEHVFCTYRSCVFLTAYYTSLSEVRFYFELVGVLDCVRINRK